MSLLVDDKDIAKIRDAASQVIKDAIGQAASTLVPAIASAFGSAVAEIKITIGPITIEPVEVEISIGEQKV